ncbi:basic secretory family protein [Niabella sp. CC-SYL272]|uniref:basic secretory family protein n=1 Tax=Niabella agricola TaxID=2891571 RepID=UPI001F2BAE70|nr:basic secretory family protein [Niabella agricola]MCF3107388.1 basic secretory family protein [Niabella agricola]
MQLKFYKKTPLLLVPVLLCMGFRSNSIGKKAGADPLADTIRQKGITLIVEDRSEGMDNLQKQGLIRTFFTNYPRFIKTFNPKATRTILFRIDSGYTGVAYADAKLGMVCYGADYMKKHPKDMDVVTHEVMHVIQNYPSGPGWVTEGIADYVRHVYGVNNAATGWALRSPRPGESYTNGYGTAARLFAWIERRVQKGTVKKLNAAMRSGTYTDNFWIKETGKSIEQLWQDYINKPEL